MEQYKIMVDSVEVMPNLRDVDRFSIGSTWFCAVDKNGKYDLLINVLGIKNKAEAFGCLRHYSIERMKKEQSEIFKVKK